MIAFLLFGLNSCFWHYATAEYTVTQQQFNQDLPSIDSKLEVANSVVRQAFNAILNAEAASANVTDLISRLAEATDLLSQAENAYRIGDFNTTIIKVDSALPIAQEVYTAAQAAEQVSSISFQNTFRFTLILALIGIIILVIILFIVWRKFSKRYVNSLSEAKPTVNLNET